MSKTLEKLKQLSDNLETGMVLDTKEANKLINKLSDRELTELFTYTMSKKN